MQIYQSPPSFLSLYKSYLYLLSKWQKGRIKWYCILWHHGLDDPGCFGDLLGVRHGERTSALLLGKTTSGSGPSLRQQEPQCSVYRKHVVMLLDYVGLYTLFAALGRELVFQVLHFSVDIRACMEHIQLCHKMSWKSRVNMAPTPQDTTRESLRCKKDLNHNCSFYYHLGGVMIS